MTTMPETTSPLPSRSETPAKVRPGRQRRRVSGIVIMRHGQNALDVIDRVKAKIKEIEPGLPPGRENRPHLRPLGPDPALHRQPQIHGDRSPDHGGLRGFSVPLAHPQRPDSGDHPAHRHPHLFYSFPDAGDHGQYHVPGGDCDCHRGHGGCGHRGGGTGAQKPGDLGPDGPAGGLSVRGDPGGEAGRRAELFRPAGDRGFFPARS